VSNPVDSGGGPSGDWRGRKILEALVADPNIGVIVCPFVANAYHLSDAVARDVIDVAATTDKPICIIWGSPTGTEPVYQELLIRSEVTVFRTFQQCITALKGYFDYHARRAGYTSPLGVAAGPGVPAAAALVARAPSAASLSEVEAKQLLAAYGIPVTHDIVVTSAAEARKAAALIGYPVVMKISSRDIEHKSDLGLVKVGLTSGQSVALAYRDLTARATQAAPAAVVDGVLVSELATGGVETVVGMVHDDVFGPAIMFGLGGVFVEVLRDVSFRVPPFSEGEARSMIAELRGRPLLDGVRGTPPCDIDALVATLMNVQRLVADLGGDIGEIDINPLLARADGVVAVDALVRMR